ncbi:insulin receptor substrate 1-B isoform X1 [Alosa sapidissima]|uniref:insulin receptor substrate 1-B isoform X1 n=1 Tax=Alosa sapidissima TaxID=34773 RepID=UPI001C09AEF3|nr:insulin receptor substrate 1-B isoform X1 [Alosa sapidissima]
MENQSVVDQQSYEDVRKSGYLRKQKSMHRRYFVLRAASPSGPARLEYYESEKKFRGKAPVPKKAVVLETCLNINKRADAKNKHMIVLYTRTESFAIAADNEVDQEDWYQAMVDMHCKSKIPLSECGSGDYGVPTPGPAFKEVWQVKVWPKGLGQAKNLVGIYRLCLTDKTVNFVKLNSDAAGIVLQLMNVRRCGHSENFFFVEVGRSAVTGPGEFWMQVEDSVVAQNMHETLLEAMKSLSEEFRQRSKSQSGPAAGGGATASNPISVPSRRHHPNPPPSQVGLTRRPRTEPPTSGGATAAGAAGSNAAGGGNAGSGRESDGGSNASPTPRYHSFPRTRTASDGAKSDDMGGGGHGGGGGGGGGVTSGPASPTPNGSSRSSTPILRSTSVRAPPSSKHPHGLMRSTSTPAAPSCPPNRMSPAGHHGSDFCPLSSTPGGAGVAGGSSSSMSSSLGGGGSGSGSQGGAYSRVPSLQASLSGSLSDYGGSSDEYGSSPGEGSLLALHGLASLGGRDQDDEDANYILMSQQQRRTGSGQGNVNPGTTHHYQYPGGNGTQQQQPPQGARRILRRSSSRECEADRRFLSKRASLPPMALERLAPPPSSSSSSSSRRGADGDVDQAEVEDDYAVMSCSAGQDSFVQQRRDGVVASSSSSQQPSGSLGGPAAYLDMSAELRGENGGSLGSAVNAGGGGGGGGGSARDNGYMSMLPGVTATPPSSVSNSLVVAVADPNSGRHASDADVDDYMAMTPNSSVSPPQSIRPPPAAAIADGYMMMSPNGSCSPDQRGLSGGAWLGSGSADSRAGSDYMNMSPISARSISGSPPLPPLSEHHARSDPHGNAHGHHHHGNCVQPLQLQPQHPHQQQQQPPPAPKMVYSYYSLPRSYKHNATARFEDGPGRGKRLAAAAGSRGAGGGGFRGPGTSSGVGSGSKVQDPHLGGPLSGRHLSLSSSSYSSSSASSESLGEGEDKTPHGAAGAAAGVRAATRAKNGALQQDNQQQQGQWRGSARLKQQQQQQPGLGQRNRPVSLFVDVSKANTLPRVRESPLPPEPKSPGEYVSIEFKGEHCARAGTAVTATTTTTTTTTAAAGAAGGRGFRPGFWISPTSSSSTTSASASSSSRPLPRPMSCLAGFLPVSPGGLPPPSATSEYVNMDLGPSPSPSPSPLLLTPLGFPSFSTPPTPPLPSATAPKARDELRSVSSSSSRSDEAGKEMRQQAPDSPTSCGDYTEMAFSLSTSTPTTSPKGPLPDRPESIPPGPGLVALGLPLDFPLGASKQGPNPDHGAKVIRADPQGRRRHCSETFLSTAVAAAAVPVSSLGSSSSSSSSSVSGGGGGGGLPEHAQAVARRLGFDSILWGSSIAASPDSPSPSQHGPPVLPIPQGSSAEQGLNYIDLDLANKESPHSGLEQAQTIPARLFSSVLGGGAVGVTSVGLGAGASNLNTYASIDFYKSEELRTHQSTGKDTVRYSSCLITANTV